MDRSSTTKGNYWRHNQILDLLDVWGEEKIQEQLRATYRNIDSFEVIAQEMRKRGHQRTAKECRTKTKAMRLEYRRVLNHNQKSGNNAATCPYYSQLHSILRGDPTLRPKRVVTSLEIWRTAAQGQIFTEENVIPNMSSTQNSGVDFEFGNSEELLSDTTDTGGADFNPQTPEIQEEDGTISDNQADEASISSNNEETPPAVNELENDLGIPNHVARLSPATRLAMTRNRRSRRRANDIAERLIEHCTKENEKTRKLLQEEEAAFTRYLRNTERAAERVQAEYREDRRELISSIQLHATILQKLVDKLPDANRNISETGLNSAEIHEIEMAAQTLNEKDDMTHPPHSFSCTPKKYGGLVSHPRRLHKPNIPFLP